jgi:hypothetical protein
MVCAMKLGLAVGGVMLIAIPVVRLVTEGLFNLLGI